MHTGKFFQDREAALCQGYDYFAAVMRRGRTVNKAFGFQTIDEAHGAMVFYLQAFSQFTDGDLFPPWKAPDGQQSLMLLGSQANSFHGRSAETSEAAQGKPKFCKNFVFRLRDQVRIVQINLRRQGKTYKSIGKVA